MLPGAKYVDPELSWKYESGPAGTTFVTGSALGAHERRHALDWLLPFVPAGRRHGREPLPPRAVPRPKERRRLADPHLAERVADNLSAKFDGTESESLIIGRGFGTTPSIEQGPDGNLYVVSITDGAIYKISKK